MTAVLRAETVADGFGYLESPRWHDGALWVSDVQERRVHRVVGDRASVHVSLADRPGGLGFLPGGDLLVVGMEGQQVHRVDREGRATVHADLSGLAVCQVNDMATTADGVSYVGMFGYDLSRRDRPRPAPLLCVSADGAVSVAAPDLLFANGMSLIDEDRTLLVSETAAQRITAFTVAPGGGLVDRRVFAQIAPRAADGICADAEGGVWLGSPFTSEFVRVEAGGRVTHTIATPGCWAVACGFGGADRSQLYLTVAETSMERFHRDESAARIDVVAAPVAGYGGSS